MRLVMAALLSLLSIAPAASSARADTCDTTCIYNQLMNAPAPIVTPLPVRADGSISQIGDGGVAYIGPNGLELRWNHDGSWKFLFRMEEASIGGEAWIVGS